MPVTYSIEGNDLFRDGVKIAVIKLDRTIDFVDDDARAFALPLTKFLAEQGRYIRETGEAVYLMPEGEKPQEETNPEPLQNSQQLPGPQDETGPELLQNPQQLPEPPGNFGEIASVAELVSAMQPHIEEPAPAMSPVFGDNTPELWRWIHSHGDIVALLKQAHRFTGSLAARKDI